ncbi:lectin-like domain-containing protein [Fluviicola taffensis]|nr:hypothetical protein [Fluviicola taffensis]
MKQAILLLLFSGLLVIPVYACTGGTASGTLTPTAAYQTVSTQNGRYYTINVVKCNQYEFTFCAGGGASGMDSELTLLDATGATQIVYADDVCGSNASINWTAAFTGTIRILITRYSCNTDLTSTMTLAYKMVANTGDYCLSGNASYQTIGGQSCIQLTPETNDQTGCAWNSSVIDFNQGFNLTLNYYFGNNINGADGTTFTFQPNPTGCGTAGGQLGAGGIPNSLIIEFDTYDNDNPAHVFDLLADHISIETDGNLVGPAAPYCGPTPAFASSANLDDGAVHTIMISWDPVTHNLKVSVDGNLRLTCNGDFVNTVFGGDNTVYWGATAATGGLNNQQYFCPSTVVLPVELSIFKTSCDGKNNRLFWRSETESRLDHYILEYTFDGHVFYPLQTITASGNSEVPIEYNYVDQQEWHQQIYYRLTSVDLDGTMESSDLISAFNCKVDSKKLITSIHSEDGKITIHFTDNLVLYQVIDLNGKPLTRILENEKLAENELLNSFSQGIYLLKAWNKDGTSSETHRFFVTH